MMFSHSWANPILPPETGDYNVSSVGQSCKKYVLGFQCFATLRIVYAFHIVRLFHHYLGGFMNTENFFIDIGFLVLFYFSLLDSGSSIFPPYPVSLHSPYTHIEQS